MNIKKYKNNYKSKKIITTTKIKTIKKIIKRPLEAIYKKR